MRRCVNPKDCAAPNCDCGWSDDQPKRRDPQRMADDTDALIWFGKWASIGLGIVGVVYLLALLINAIWHYGGAQ